MRFFQPIQLIRPITYSHPDFWGRTSNIQLRPSHKNEWRWVPDDGTPLPIEPGCITTDCRRMQLSARNKKLEVLEHIGVLRFGGLLGVNLVGTGWPPYHGRALELWNMIQSQSEPLQNANAISHYTVSEAARFEYSKCRGSTGESAFTEIRPAIDRELRLDIHIDYPGLGQHSETFNLPDSRVFTEICSAHAQGWPRYTSKIERIVRCLGWPHKNCVTWPNDRNPKETLRLFALHRAQDLLGALSLLCKDGFFVGHVISNCSGHHGDFKAVKMAHPLLERI